MNFITIKKKSLLKKEIPAKYKKDYDSIIKSLKENSSLSDEERDYKIEMVKSTFESFYNHLFQIQPWKKEEVKHLINLILPTNKVIGCYKEDFLKVFKKELKQNDEISSLTILQNDEDLLRIRDNKGKILTFFKSMFLEKEKYFNKPNLGNVIFIKITYTKDNSEKLYFDKEFSLNTNDINFIIKESKFFN